MTSAELLALSPDAKRIKIAELLGWKRVRHGLQNRSDPIPRGWQSPGGREKRSVPDYTTDQNAIIAAAAKLTPAQQVHFINALLVAVTGKPLHGTDLFGYSQAFALAQASAEQRADAVLIALEVAE